MQKNQAELYKNDSFKSSNMEDNHVSPAPSVEGLMWQPLNVDSHNLTLLRQQINAEHGIELKDYQELHKWSCQNYHLFWGHVWDFCNILASEKRSEFVVDPSMPIEQIPKWFPGVKLNYAENLLRLAQSDI